MMGGSEWIQQRTEAVFGGTAVLGPETSEIGLVWLEQVSGTLDATGAMVGGQQFYGSGTCQGLVMEEPARAVQRQVVELQVGDLILDLLPSVDLSKNGLRFVVNGRRYMQKEIGERSRAALNAYAGGRAILQTIVLRPET